MYCVAFLTLEEVQENIVIYQKRVGQLYVDDKGSGKLPIREKFTNFYETVQ